MTALTLTPTTPAGTDTDFSAGLTPALIGSIRRERLDHMIVFDALGPHGPGHPRDLVGKRDGGDLRRPPREQCREPGPTLGAVDLGRNVSMTLKHLV